jgi:hypothetical protein
MALGHWHNCGLVIQEMVVHLVKVEEVEFKLFFVELVADSERAAYDVHCVTTAVIRAHLATQIHHGAALLFDVQVEMLGLGDLACVLDQGGLIVVHDLKVLHAWGLDAVELSKKVLLCS